ncbi:MAG: diguanylate cyclase [Betaproteobacteria bacterium]|nr:diguanylate cyclase [Betaproteobacteria bacterium]
MSRPTPLLPVIAGFGVMLLLIVSVAVIGLSHIRRLNHELTSIVSDRSQKAELATAMSAMHEARHHALLHASFLADPFERDAAIARFGQLARDFIVARDRFLALPMDDKELALWNAVRQDVRFVEQDANLVIGLLEAGRTADARKRLEKNLAPHQIEMMATWERLVRLQQEKNRFALKEAGAAHEHARRLMLYLSIATLAVGVLVAWFVVRLSRRMEQDLFEEKNRAQATLQAIGDAVIRFDRERCVRYLNPMAETLLGKQSEASEGMPMEACVHLVDKERRADLTAPLLDEVLAGASAILPGAACLVSTHGMEFDVDGRCTPLQTADGTSVGGVLVLRDITEAREMQRQLQWQAEHDGLTGVSNRRLFEARLSRVLSSKRAADLPLSVMYVDLDDFKQVNDQAGHAAGDELLRQVAFILREHVRESDVVARLGSDEFGVLLVSCPGDKARQIAETIRTTILNYRLYWENRSFQIASSIGLVSVPPHWATLDECLSAADSACAQAKKNGRNQIVFHASAAAEGAPCPPQNRT